MPSCHPHNTWWSGPQDLHVINSICIQTCNSEDAVLLYHHSSVLFVTSQSLHISPAYEGMSRFFPSFHHLHIPLFSVLMLFHSFTVLKLFSPTSITCRMAIICSADVTFFHLLLMSPWRPIISECTGSIFIKFSL